MPRSMYSKVPRHSILATRPQRLLIISPRRQVLTENKAGILFDSRDYVTTLELGRFFPPLGGYPSDHPGLSRTSEMINVCLGCKNQGSSSACAPAPVRARTLQSPRFWKKKGGSSSWAPHRPGPNHRKYQPEETCFLTDEKNVPTSPSPRTDICHSVPTSTRLKHHLERRDLGAIAVRPSAFMDYPQRLR